MALVICIRGWFGLGLLQHFCSDRNWLVAIDVLLLLHLQHDFLVALVLVYHVWIRSLQGETQSSHLVRSKFSNSRSMLILKECHAGRFIPRASSFHVGGRHNFRLKDI